MAKKKDTMQITFRAPKDVINQLDELCRILGVKRGEFIIVCITSEYDKINGDPKLKEILEQFRGIKEKIKGLTGQAPAGSGEGGA